MLMQATATSASHTPFMAADRTVGVKTMLMRESARPGNCHTITRHGRKPYIAMSERFSIEIGSAFVGRDMSFNKDINQPFGCFYHPTNDGKSVIRRAVPTLLHPRDETKKSFYVLRRPTKSDIDEVLVKIDTTLPYHGKVVKGNFELHIHGGISTTGTVITRFKSEALVCLKDDERLDVMYPDGYVTSFVQDDGELVESHLPPMAMVDIRVKDAHQRLVDAQTITDVEVRKKMVRDVLNGMADLLHVTDAVKIASQDVRRKILQDFFLKLEREQMSVVHKKLWAILSNVDPVLREMLRGSSHDVEDQGRPDFSGLSRMFKTVVEKKGLTPSQIAAKKAQRSAEDREERLAMQGASSGGGSQEKKKAKGKK